MATEALGDERPALFLRNATGLVRGWNVRDSLIYAVLATNFVTLGMYEFTFAGSAFPQGQMLTSVLISAVLVSFLVVAYTGLIVTIPRGRRRLRLADPHPGQRPRLRDGDYRLVVHPLAVGAHLRQHPRGPVLRAAMGDARQRLRRRLVRHE